MKRHVLILATLTMCSGGIQACGSSHTGTAGEGARVRAAATAAAATHQPSEASPSSKPKRQRPRRALMACDSNVKVDASTTTCAFAQNVFFEYWRATQSGEGSSIEAYSPISRRAYELECSERRLITCRADDGSRVSFPATAVDVYEADQANRYACSHDLGPSESHVCPSGRRSGSTSRSSRSSEDCDPNYEGACLDPNAIDYDCEGGSGDGPQYIGRVQVVGDDHYGLDRDGDGAGCDASSSSPEDSSTGYAPDVPTTEDFGSGSGSVGFCRDGTLSDSIGRPGACSHHGGVG
jgi:hypothetical protein